MTLRFSAPIAHLFSDLPLLDRIAAAKDAGFEAVDLPFPYEGSATELRTALIMAGAEMALMCAPPPNWTGGPRGFAAVPGLEDRFRRDLDRALRFADVLKARHLCLLPGPAAGPEARAVLVANLRHACARAPKASFLLAPGASEADGDGGVLPDYGLAAAVIAEVGAPNLGLVLDAGQAARITGDATAVWAAHGPLVRHVRVSGPPDGGTPEILDVPAFLDRLAADGYRGFVGADRVLAQAAPAHGSRR